MTKYGTALLLILLLLATASARQPNVILIMTDDQGYGDMSCHGNPHLKTPHLDRLHASSVRLTDFHVDPTCSPTRAALMTGRYSSRVGVWLTYASRHHLRRGEVTMADVFRRNGYTTGIFGKWHLGDEEAYRPDRRGFDEVYIHGAGGIAQNYPHSADFPITTGVVDSLLDGYYDAFVSKLATGSDEPEPEPTVEPEPEPDGPVRQDYVDAVADNLDVQMTGELGRLVGDGDGRCIRLGAHRDGTVVVVEDLLVDRVQRIGGQRIGRRRAADAPGSRQVET